jgi:hypothetical protein
MRITATLAASVLALAASRSGAQSLASRVDAVRDGRVLMTFDARPGVCGDGQGGTWIQSSRNGYSSGNRQYTCIAGPVRVAIGRADKQTVSVRKWVGGRWSAGGSDVDIGVVSPTEAARYLLALAHTVGGNNAGDAVSAAAFADVADVSPELASLVRDDAASLEARKQALFWLGQSDFATTDLVRLHESLKPFALREHYTFVLSQRHEDAAIDGLIDVARHDPDTEIRKRAMFWLGQTREPKAIKFFQDILTR